MVGPSGTGKTTLINLILGLFEPHTGSVRADGIPIQELTQESWLGKIGFVSQDTFLFHSTIADNILFGREDHTQESVIRAAKIANAHDFITELPLSYDTVVGDRGMRLSGGQQQRLAIARAMLSDPEILIFDEATSSLDTIAERQVQQAIDNVSSDRTVILIAHRLSTVQRADKIIVIHEGQVVEEGTHQELLDMDGHYSQLVAASSQ
jgi:subfamily B ATP-binding cassette protein MsbA